jgi:hypothetical protein
VRPYQLPSPSVRGHFSTGWDTRASTPAASARFATYASRAAPFAAAFCSISAAIAFTIEPPNRFARVVIFNLGLET